MCYGCWSEQGKPQIDTPLVREAAKAVAEVYEHSCAGGNLHIVLDDWNLEDSSLEYCSQQIANQGWKDVRPLSPRTEFMRHKWPDPPEQLAAERRCCDLFQRLSEDERASALALNDGFWGGEAERAASV